MKFSVLMSGYFKENPDDFDQSLHSILINQTVLPNELILVEDGPLTNDLIEVIDKFKKKFPSIMKIIKLKKNSGLGVALNIGLKHCKYDLIARMDSDDISDKFRFEKQLKYMTTHPEISVLGGFIEEKSEETKIKKNRKTPENHKDIKKMLIRRNPINHVSVMFRKSVILKVGGYMDMPYLEDYYLWARVIGNDYKVYNLQEVLVYVKEGDDMYKRRSNPKQILEWFSLQKRMISLNLTTRIEALSNMVLIIVFVYTPSKFKAFLYKNILRDESNAKKY